MRRLPGLSEGAGGGEGEAVAVAREAAEEAAAEAAGAAAGEALAARPGPQVLQVTWPGRVVPAQWLPRLKVMDLHRALEAERF